MKPESTNTRLISDTEKPFRIPLGEIRRRKRAIQKQMQQNHVDGLFIAQRVDLLYFSGTAQNGFLFMPAEGEPLLFIKRYWPRARQESPLENIFEIQSVRDIPGLISDYVSPFPKIVAFELDVLPVNYFNFYQGLFKTDQAVDGSPLILNVRMLKSDWEIEQMERTAELSRKTFEYMRTVIRPGLSEIEFAGMFETFARKHGHGAKMRVRDYQTEGYPWHVLSGKSGGMVGMLDSPASGEGTSAAFPCGAGPKLLAANEPIMVDLSTILNGYHMDETRMFAIGSLPDQAQKACEAAITIQHTLLEKARPGITVGELFQLSVETAELLGYAEPYLGPPGYKVTFVGHGVGLELIEPPVIAKDKNDRLESGMTFALEPKMVFQNEFSAGVESVFLVTDRGARLISRVPVQVFIC